MIVLKYSCTHVTQVPFPICRIYFKHRARSIAGVKINNKGSFQTNLNCRFCDLETEETQEHLEECGGQGAYERRRLNLSEWFGLVCFWRRMMKKISTTTADRVGATTMTTTTTTSAAAVVTIDGYLTWCREWDYELDIVIYLIYSVLIVSKLTDLYK